ncbi:MAG: AgmX/PglI C-terminal domain-containing protein, partial [Myxococcales bacterium]|nr:AgmX/PglI C-terminal domain-containing protein [Myxococcales bacterium]
SKLRQRLEQLLVDEEHKPSYLVQPHKPDPPFSHALVPYFPKNEEGTVMMRLFLIGGDSATSDRLGTFDIGRAMRTEAEKACPLCDHDISLSRSVSGSNWVVIPESTEDFASSMVVFYYDLEHNRIPDRYGDLLPIPLETVKAELALGKSFTVAKERPGAPPILLIAAPRTHLIAEAEEKVSQLDHLPTALEELDVSTKLRSDEIQAIMRASWMPHIRACYETLLKRAPQASGRFSTFFSIGADGRVSDVEPSTDDRPLQDGAFLDCIVKAAQEVTFPPTDGTTTVRYPVVVTPD